MRIRGDLIVLCAASVFMVACGSSSDARTGSAASSSAPSSPRPSTTVPRAPADPYVAPDPLPAGDPGALIWAEKVPLPLNPPGTVWRILYHSRSRTGRDIAVSGFAIVPTAAAPQGGRTVYAWGHGTAGQGDQCAPSRDVRENLPPYGGQQIERGGVITATDYEGLGTSGEARYLVGESEGHAMLDSVRAAQELPGAGRFSDVVVAGHSQGGGAALWAAQLASKYAPDLKVVGVLASAPSSELPMIAGLISTSAQSPYKGAALLATRGLHAEYGKEFDPTTFLTPAARADLPQVARECVDATIERWRDRPATDMLSTTITEVPAALKVLTDNSPGATATGVPIRIQQGSDDAQVPLAATATLLDRYCKLGDAVTRTIYEGADHEAVIDAASDDAIQWLNDRYDNRRAQTDCP